MTEVQQLSQHFLQFLKNSESKQEDEKEEKAEEDGAEEATSPQKSTEPVAEENALYSKKCKLFYKSIFVVS